MRLIQSRKAKPPRALPSCVSRSAPHNFSSHETIKPPRLVFTMSIVATATTSPQRSSNFDVVIPITPRSRSAIATSDLQPADDEDDDDLSDAEIARLLGEATERMSKGSSVTLHKGTNVTSIKLPKLDPGSSLPKAPITSNRFVARISGESMLVLDDERELANKPLPAPATSGAKNKKSKDAVAANAGPKWFDLPRTDPSPAVRRDMQLIKARNVLDAHRHYRKDTSALPEFSQVGTIIEGKAEFHSARINRKDRKKTIVDEILADGTNRDRFKRKYDELQKGKKSGKKEYYRKLQEQRRKKLKFAQ
ncbi:Fcf2 pre-rRNA processing-domain-containing protein [Geopyxis carbonaria]|nr:Fcf2 pre-rRNA processing-domain-containing protein [Geopyxis carbonaria]